MIQQKSFLKKYNISESSYEKTGLEWKQLENIYDIYEKDITKLEPILAFFVENLRRVPKIHSIKARLKNPEHLIEKIIRLKQANSTLEININNFKEVITDIVGLRALHLFKADWESIHDWIMNSLEVKGKPVVNIREGDLPELVGLFEKKGCEVKKHPFGYRSAHYCVISKPSKDEIVAEIQVRTIFEEGWSEIDHLIRYPYVKDNPILEQYLVMFNRLAGSADEMGTYIMYLNAALKKKEFEFSKAIEEKTEKNLELQNKIDELNAKIEEMKIDHKDKALLKHDLEQISDITTSMPDYSKYMTGLTAGLPDITGLTAGLPDITGLTAGLPDMTGFTAGLPDITGLTAGLPDITGLTAGLPDMTGLTAGLPDITGLTPKIPDSLVQMKDSPNDSSPMIDENSGETIDQKSQSSKEDKTENNQPKDKGQNGIQKEN